MGLDPGSPEASIKPGLWVRGPGGGSALRPGPTAVTIWWAEPGVQPQPTPAGPLVHSPRAYIGSQIWATARKGTRERSGELVRCGHGRLRPRLTKVQESRVNEHFPLDTGIRGRKTERQARLVGR